MPSQSKEPRVELEVRNWDVAKFLLTDGFYLVLGIRGAGKTSFTEVLLQQDPKIHQSIIVVMVGSEKVRANWVKSIPRLHVIDPNIAFLQNMIKIQNEHTAKYFEQGLPLPDHLHVDLILDDIALYSYMMNDKIFQELAASSRNLGMRIFVLCQYLMQVPKASRGGFDGILMCGEQNEDELKELHKKYANFMEKRLFIASAITYTQNHGLFIIDRREHECFKMTMTWPIVSIPLGAPSQHEHSKQHYLNLQAHRAKERDRKLMVNEEEEYLHYRDEKGLILFRTEKINSNEEYNDEYSYSDDSLP